MADNAQAPFTGTGTADVVVATDQAAGGEHVQLVKLAYSANASTTHGTLDADGLLVNLGSNNDVTVTGTVTANLSATDNAVLDSIDTDTSTIASDTTEIATATHAIDAAVGGSDVGVALLAKHQEDEVHLTTAEGDYDILRMSSLGALYTEQEKHHTFDDMNATTGWAALGNDTLNLATASEHTVGTAALEFDKVNGAANTVFAGIEKTVTTVDLGDVSAHDILQTSMYVSSIADIDYIFLRLGTDSSNYNEWRIDGANVTAGTFETLSFIVGDTSHTGSTGTGWNVASVSYCAIGIAFDAETNTLAGIIFDQISYHTNLHSAAQINAEVSSSVSSPNVRLNGYGGSTDTGTGNASSSTLRTVLASDQPVISVDDNGGALTVDGTVTANLSATDNAVLDAIDSNTNYGAVIGGGAEATALRVTMASNSSGVLSVDDNGSTLSIDDGGSSISIDDGGNTITVNGTVTANLSATDNAVLDAIAADTGEIDTNMVAHDAADAGNPLKVGFKAWDHTTNPSAVANGDRSNLTGYREGVLAVLGTHPDMERICNNYTTAQTNTVLKTVNSGQRFAVTSYLIAVDGDVTVSSIDCQLESTTTDLARHPGITAGAGYGEGDGSGVVFVTADSGDLEFTCDVPTGGSIQVMVTGFITAD